MRERALQWSMLGLVGLLGGIGCDRRVPDDIVQKSMQSTLRQMPGTASAMCGATVKGFASTEVRISKRGEKNTGVVHVVGRPWLTAGGPKQCEGDLEYAYSYSSKTSRLGRKRRTTVTWSLDSLKLIAVQTPGVTFSPVQEAPAEADDDDKPEAAK